MGIIKLLASTWLCVALAPVAQASYPEVSADGSAVFFYQGTGQEKSVRIVGEFKLESFYSTNWDKAGLPMLPLAGSGIYTSTLHVDPAARLEYQFIVDGQRITDPLNPRKVFNGVVGGEASEWVMPGYRLPPPNTGTPPFSKGRLQPVVEEWAFTAIQVYLPAGYDSARSYPVLYTADGNAWRTYMDLPATLDRLIATHAIEPVIAVMVDPTEDRRNWYLFNRDYLEYLEKVVRFIDSKFATRPDPHQRLHLGTSAAGRASLFVGFERPDLFLNVAMLSPSLTGSVSYFEPYFSGRKRPDPGLKAWISAGAYEGSLLEDAKVLQGYLRAQGLRVGSATTQEGHSLQAWRYGVGKALEFFLSP